MKNDLLFFLDMLGFKTHLHKSYNKGIENEKYTQNIFEALNDIERFTNIHKGFESRFKASHFSDSIVISSPVIDEKSIHIFRRCWYSSPTALSIIVVGRLCHTNNGENTLSLQQCLLQGTLRSLNNS